MLTSPLSPAPPAGRPERPAQAKGTEPSSWQPPLPLNGAAVPLERPDLAALAQTEALLPQFVKQCRVAMRYRHLLGVLDWSALPERDPKRAWPGPRPHPRRAYVAAFVIKLNQDLRYMSDLRDYLLDHPALIWLLGFHLQPDPHSPWGFDPDGSLPTSRHFGRVLRDLPNEAVQVLLSQTVALLQAELPETGQFGNEISLDTKHILAWVKENNPKAYLSESERLDKTRQPSADPDCKLGCKKKANRPPPSSAVETTAAEEMPTPTKNPVRPTNFSASDQYYWGYASGVVATKVPGWGEFVLAELTQPFNKGDATYFLPLMAQVEARLGFRPRYGAFDKAFDAFYVYQHFDEAGGFAAVPFVKRGNYQRTFDPEGLPICEAGFSMPLKATFICHTTEVDHERGRYACPLLYPAANGFTCPIEHQNWAKGGCLTTMATAKGARVRLQLDRESDAFKRVYKQRTATERINSQATALGIERPKLRRGSAITNHNTLIYLLINLRAYQRLKAQRDPQADDDCSTD